MELSITIVLSTSVVGVRNESRMKVDTSNRLQQIMKYPDISFRFTEMNTRWFLMTQLGNKFVPMSFSLSWRDCRYNVGQHDMVLHTGNPFQSVDGLTKDNE